MLALLVLAASLAAPQTRATLANQDATDSGSLPRAAQLTPAMLADLDAYAADALRRFGVPGASVSVVQGGRTVHSRGFGVVELGGNHAVTADTLFLMGSIGKGMTAQMIGTLIDDGVLTWDTRIIDVLPQFAMSDPSSTESVTFRDLLSMRSGLPRNDVPLFLTALTADQVTELVATVPLLGPPGEAYGYSNPGYSVAGYAAAAAVVGPHNGDPVAAYLDLMTRRFYEPVGMRRLTTDFDAGANAANRASSHTISARGDLMVLDLDQERFGSNVLPAGGAAWATVEDLSAYIALQLRRGVATDGRRVVSENSVLDTWEPHTQMPDGGYFGLGWITTEPYHGLRHIAYNGGNLGYSSLVSFLPDADIGVAVLSNTSIALSYMQAVAEYAYELAFGLQHTADARHTEQAREQDAFIEELGSSVGEVGDPASLAPFVGSYGDVTIGFDARGRFVLSNGFGDIALVPLLGMEQTYLLDGLLGGTATFAAAPDGRMSVTFSRPIGEPQPALTLVRS
jgi:CubicO group peptidase (beta-lactamase class C family)